MMITKVKYTRIWKKFTFKLCLSSQASSCNQAFKKNGVGAGAGGGDTLRSKIFIWHDVDKLGKKSAFELITLPSWKRFVED